MSTGWWRRNRWGLAFLVPAALALLALSAEHLYAGVYKTQPRTAVAAGQDGSFELAGTRIRLVDLGPATDVKTYGGSRFEPPPHVVIWRARIEFFIVVPKGPDVDLFPGLHPSGAPAPAPPDPDATPESQLGACSITVQDSEGRLYDDDPYDMLLGSADTVGHGCMADFDVPDPLHYTNSIYFALPAGAQPVAVRVSDIMSLPNYVRLTPGRLGRLNGS